MNYRQFAYVKVYGSIRVFKEQKAIVGTHIHRIVDFDEITNHLLQRLIAQLIHYRYLCKLESFRLYLNSS